MAKQRKLTKADVIKLKLEVLPQDNLHDPTGAAKMRDKADWYILCNPGFLVRASRSQVSDAAWDCFEGGHRAALSSTISHQLEQMMPDWLDAVCPQAGGLLEPVKFAKVKGTTLPNVQKQTHFKHGGTVYFLPMAQVWLVKGFWPDAAFYIGPHFSGVDLFGEPVTKMSPVIAATEEDGAVAAIALMRDRL